MDFKSMELGNQGKGQFMPLTTLHALENYVQSKAFCDRVAGREGVNRNANWIGQRIKVRVLPEEGIAQLTLSMRDERPLRRVLEACALEAKHWADLFFRAEAEAAEGRVRERLEGVESDLRLAHEELRQFEATNGTVDFEREKQDWIAQYQQWSIQRDAARMRSDQLSAQIQELKVEVTRHHPSLLELRQQLNQALLRYTEEHPHVKELRSTLARIEQRLSTEGSDMVDPEIATRGSSLARELYAQVIELRTQQAALDQERADLESRLDQTEARLKSVPDQQLEYIRLMTRRSALIQTREMLLGWQADMTGRLNLNGGGLRIGLPVFVRFGGNGVGGFHAWTMAGVGMLMGLLLSCLGFGWMELRDRRIENLNALSIATRLPVLAALGDLRAMTRSEIDRWAFETLTLLKGVLNRTSQEALVCGFASAHHGEGRSTWVRLLADAAQKRGYQVLTVQAGSEPGNPRAVGEDVHTGCRRIEDPKEISGALQEAGAIPRWDLRPADWVWNLQCREEWQSALEKCRSHKNLVVLVELPPSTEPESLLLSENLSQVIWLCGGGMARVEETQKHITMLRLTRAQLVGAVFNGMNSRWPSRSPIQSVWSRLAIWTCLILPWVGMGQENTPQGTNVVGAAGSLSVLSPLQMASWQKRLTLGPGDVMTISIYSQADTSRQNLAIGPDGRLNYLQARDVMASGLTVDELRAKLESILSQYYRPPLRVNILPQAYNSKKYYLLGNVNGRGVFPMNHPLTIMEAIARAGGFVQIGEQRNTLMVADLSRSFLVRRGETGAFHRVEVKFEDLFLRGDLSQNLVLEPDDYLYFPPLDAKEIYVLGTVRRPGVVAHTPGTTMMRALVSVGGFGERAYRRRVLVVRGSLQNPQSFIVNVNDVLGAEAPDFVLEPGDIVYVSRRPWAKAEELLELAITEFLRAAIVTWTGQNVGPLIDQPIFD